MSGWFRSLTGLVLADPWMLLVLVLVPVALWLRRRAGRPALLFSPAALVGDGGAVGAPLPRTWRVRLLPLPVVLEVLGLTCAAVALARPVERVPQPSRMEGIDVVLCLDVSSSMTARDLDARRSRLEVAKDAAAEFVRGRPHDRIGLVTFARYADLRCPPTLDHDALAAILAGVAHVEGDGPEDATAIGAATARAAQVLRGGVARSKVAILLSDGEENVATQGAAGQIAPAHAAQLCAELGVRVYAIAAGSAEATGGRAAIDTAPVRRLAARTGGRFYEARDASALADVYASIGALERSDIDDARYVMEDRFLPFLVAALVLLVAARMSETTALGVAP